MDRNPAGSSAGQGDALDLSVLGGPSRVATVNMKHGRWVGWRTILDESRYHRLPCRIGAQ